MSDQKTRRYECITCGRSPRRSDGSDPARPLRVTDCETCGEPVCELCAPDHAGQCAVAGGRWSANLPNTGRRTPDTE